MGLKYFTVKGADNMIADISSRHPQDISDNNGIITYEGIEINTSLNKLSLDIKK